MKKLSAILSGLVLVGAVGFGIAMLAPFAKSPEFEVVNQSQDVVQVSVFWHEQSKTLGAIQPSSRLVFNVDDEAALKFLGRYPDGRELVSEEIYFTGGTRVIATITEKRIKVEYEHDK